MFFKKDKSQQQPFHLNDFKRELTRLVDRAIAARIHLVDIRNSLENKKQQVDFLHAQRPVI
jgi:hypothetical protein